MKSRDAVLRLKRFDVAEKRRKAADLEMMIRDFEVMAADLDRQIATEEDRTGVRDLSHFAYSTFAKAARARRDNLRTSVEDLMAKLNNAKRAVDESLADLAKLEAVEDRDLGRRGLERPAGGRFPTSSASRSPSRT